MNSTRLTTQLDAVIIGAGIAGLYQLYRLREQGLK
jgi:cation diffusion facilitator CzcD-associated flavoprotein CzcO